MKKLLLSTYFLLLSFLALSQDNQQNYYAIAVDEYRSGDYKAALKYFNKSEAFVGKHAEMFYQRGHSKLVLKDYLGAKLDMIRAIRYQNNYPEAYFDRAVAKIGLKDYTGSIKDFTTAIEQKPGWAEAYFRRALVKGDTYDPRGSCEDLKKAAELGHAEAKAMLVKGCK